MRKILLVEGKDDLMVFKNVLENHQIKESFEVEDKNGRESLFKSLPLYFKADKKTIGVVLDADFGLKKTWGKLKGILTEKGYRPNELNKQGTILTAHGMPKFGVWIMPDNKENGMLEDFIKHLVPKGDVAMPFVEETLQELEGEKLNKYKDIHRSKARVHTWLAWQKDPGTPMGLAIAKTYLDANAGLSRRFVKWINDLFNPDAPDKG